MENNNNPQTSAEQAKTVAIVSYFTLIGWIVALIMHGNAKSSLGAFHLRQMLGLMILAVATSLIRIPLLFIPFLGFGINSAISICLLILWILGLVAAINAEEKPIPILGNLFQKWFAEIGK
ncbi:MAG: hypothetical protein Q8T03_01855 [Bacteroidota bacterium]|nr:hypothetical protein [Bacteroidota bacterium]